MVLLLLPFLFLSLLLVLPLGLKNRVGEEAELKGSDGWTGICGCVASVGDSIGASGVGNVSGVRGREWGWVW